MFLGHMSGRKRAARPVGETEINFIRQFRVVSHDMPSPEIVAICTSAKVRLEGARPAEPNLPIA